jgi:hypothetical protein
VARIAQEHATTDYDLSFGASQTVVVMSSGNMRFSSTTLNPPQQTISFVWVVCRHVGLCSPFTKVS